MRSFASRICAGVTTWTWREQSWRSWSSTPRVPTTRLRTAKPMAERRTDMSSTDNHAPFAPSGLARVVACPGSYNLIRNARGAGLTLDEDDTDASREGTAAHEVAGRLVQDGELMQVGQLTSNGVAVTEEMVEGAQLYAEAVARYPGGDAFENWQLIAYAIGRMPKYLPSVRVVLQIIQPRSYHRDGPVREWIINGHELRDYAQVLHAACTKAEQPDAQCNAGPQCYECPARHVCEAALHMEQSALYLSGSTIPLDASVEAKAVRLHQIRRALDHLAQMESGITEDLAAAVQRGINVPGFTLKAGSGREKWTRDVWEVVALGAAMGVDLSKPGCITPNQARKAGLSPDIVAAYSERSAGEVKLVEDDGRMLRRIFGKEV